MSRQVELKPGLGLTIAGARLSSVAAGIRYQGRDDLLLIELAENSSVAAVFTQNRFCAAPVMLARQHLAASNTRYLLINSGNANAGTGALGMAAARACCEQVAQQAGCAVEQVLPFSTGVIGEDLPLKPFERAMPSLVAGLSEDAWGAAAAAIMTTDTVPKLCSVQVPIAGETVTVTGIAKGSGMIRPNMATMLAYIATDAQVAQPVLQQMLETAVAPSFNSITVDGDTSTNDACILMATGTSAVQIETDGDAFDALQQAVLQVCMYLARSIVRDGEGATKLVEVAVEGAASAADAHEVAETVAHSPLVKTALFAADPNWGRILAAVGRARIADMDVDAIRIWLDDVSLVRNGGRDPAYREQDGQRVMDQDAFEIRIDLGLGQASARVLTCDLSYDYVKINAEYRS